MSGLYLQADVEDGHGQAEAGANRLHVLQQHLLRVQACMHNCSVSMTAITASQQVQQSHPVAVVFISVRSKQCLEQ